MALQLVDDNRVGYWVRAANCFAYAVGRPTTGASHRLHECVGKSLKDAVQGLASTDEERLDLLGSYVGVAGKITDQNEWVVEHSINPELVGCTLVGSSKLSCGKLEQKDNDHVVQVIPLADGTEVRRTWKVMELSPGCTLPISAK